MSRTGTTAGLRFGKWAGRAAQGAATLLLAATMLSQPGPAAAQGAPALTVAQNADAQLGNLLPLRAGNNPWIQNVLETLTYNDPETFEPQPLLATDWSFSDDGKSMTLTLRDDVTYHTGRKMTAEDVKWSLETAAKPESASQTGFIARDFTSIEVNGPTELTITSDVPLNNIFDFFEQNPILDPETYDQREDGTVIGTGPYKFAGWTPGASVMLEKYDGYREPDAAQISPIEFAVIPDPTAQLSALRSGRALVAAAMSASDTIEFQRNPMWTISNSGGVIYPFGVNVTQPPFDKKEVRQAVAYAIDRERINQQIFDSTGTPTDLFWNPSSQGYSDELANHYGYDPEKAKQMIEDAGATGAKVTIIIPAIATNRSIFEIVQNNLKDIGLEPEANVLDVAEYDQRQVAGDLGQAFILIHGQVGFSSSTLISSLPSLREGNPSQFWTPEYEKLRDALSSATTSEATAEAQEALSDYMLDEAFSTTLVQAAGQTVASSRIEGLEQSRFGYLKFGHATLN